MPRSNYEIEARIRGKSAADRLALRQAESKPLVTELRIWFEAQLAKLPARGPTADAIGYALNHWDGLERFLEDGRIELDNNSVERAMRPVCLSRKNSLFAGSNEGAENWACLASLIETCKLNGVNPHAYFTDLLTRLVNGWPQKLARQPLMLAHEPSDQEQIHAAPHRLERRSVKLAIILSPALQDRSKHSRQIGHALVALQLQVPPPDHLPHRFEGVAADSRGKVHVNAPILVHRLARPERIAEKRELYIGVILGPIDVLAIHDACLARMQFEFAGLEPVPDAFKHVIRLPFAPATMEAPLARAAG